jgi:lipoprotein-releasing system permease protein
MVYLPFETLQRLNNMDATYSFEQPGKVVEPARCSMIHVKVRYGYGNERELRKIRRKIQDVWGRFKDRHPEAATGTVEVRTWREQQIHLISSIESQRTLTVIMFGIISLVAVVLIFVIFYMIVLQKTRDIGVLKAIGGSNLGVARIWLDYGVACGLVGSLLGVTGGAIFVRNINPIHDWVGRTFGFTVFSKETFMFERIPDAVDWPAAVGIVIAAMLAGLLGAILPAIRAARMQPVEALRYE